MPAIEARTTALAATLRAELAKLPGITVQDLGQQKSGIVTFTHTTKNAATLHTALRERAINTSVTPRTYALLDLGHRGIDAMVRASVHYYNTEDEIARFTTTLKSLL
jgi:cysteine desulfurase / selenocysteine lyase